MGEFSRLVLIVGPVWCLWGLGHPIGNRAWSGDGAGPLLCIVFWLAMSGIARRASFDRSGEWRLALGTTVLATLSNWEWPDLNLWILCPGLAWTAFLFAREHPLAREPEPRRRLRIAVTVAIVVSALVVAQPPLGGLGDHEVPLFAKIILVTAVVGLLAGVGILLARPHPRLAKLARRILGRPDSTWAPQLLVYGGVFLIGAFERGTGAKWPGWIEFLFFAPLVLLAGAGLVLPGESSARGLPLRSPVLQKGSAIAGLLLAACIVWLTPDSAQYSTGMFGQARFYGVPFILLLYAGLAATLRLSGRWLVRRSPAEGWVAGSGNVLRSIRLWHLIVMHANVTPLPEWAIGYFAGVLVLAAFATATEEVAMRGARLSLALAPLLLPLLCFACLRQLDTPPEWRVIVAPRGQIGAISELLPIPLLGAALVVAWQLDALRTPAKSAIAGWLGLMLLAVCVASHESLPDWGQRKFFAPVGSTDFLTALAERNLPVQGLWSATASLILAGALYAVLRLRLAVTTIWPLVLLAAIAGIISAIEVPEHGPAAALWAGVIATPIAAGAEWLAALRRPRASS